MERRTRRKKTNTVKKDRPLRPYLGKIRAVDAKFYASSGGSFVRLPLYLQQTNEDWLIAKHKQCSLLASTVLTGMADLLGREEIVYVNGVRSAMHNCVHRKLGVLNLPYAVVYEHYSKPASTLYEYFYRKATTRGYALYLGHKLDGLVNVYRPGKDLGFSARAFWSMRPKFQGEVSVINSIFELKDFKDIFKFGSIAKRIMKIAPQLRALRKTVHTRSDVAKSLARDLSGSAAAATLTYNLAYKPTLADFMAIAAQLSTVASDAQSLFGLYGGLGSTSHFSEVETTADCTPGTLNRYLWCEGTQQSITRTATMRSHYEYKMRSYKETLVKYWGLSGTVEALWNMLPMSFVLDYVFTFGKTLEYMARDDNVTNLVTEYCESVKIELTDGLHVNLTPRVHAFVLDGKFYKRPSFGSSKYLLVSGTSCSRYQRTVMDPYKGPALPKFKAPKSSQGLNLLALARVLFC